MAINQLALDQPKIKGFQKCGCGDDNWLQICSSFSSLMAVSNYDLNEHDTPTGRFLIAHCSIITLIVDFTIGASSYLYLVPLFSDINATPWYRLPFLQITPGSGTLLYDASAGDVLRYTLAASGKYIFSFPNPGAYWCRVEASTDDAFTNLDVWVSRGWGDELAIQV